MDAPQRHQRRSTASCLTRRRFLMLARRPDRTGCPRPRAGDTAAARRCRAPTPLPSASPRATRAPTASCSGPASPPTRSTAAACPTSCFPSNGSSPPTSASPTSSAAASRSPSPALAHAVHVEVAGLEPGREYFYQFKHAATSTARIGRTRTAPARDAHVERLRFAVATCQRWDDGYYTAYRHMADEELDLVLHLGDYLYEYGIDAHGGYRNVPVPEQFRAETTTLERYRLQYALYKSDPDLQRAHARFPFVVTWDDHEVAKDYTGAISQTNDAPEAFLARRAAAYQAFYEHLPIRSATLPGLPDLPVYRRLTTATC